MKKDKYDPDSFGGIVTRLLSGRTLATLARASGIKYPYLYVLCTGRRDGRRVSPSPKKIAQVVAGLEALGIPVSDDDRRAMTLSRIPRDLLAQSIQPGGERDSISCEDEKVIEAFRSLSPQGKVLFLQFLTGLAELADGCERLIG